MIDFHFFLGQNFFQCVQFEEKFIQCLNWFAQQVNPDGNSKSRWWVAHMDIG